MVAAGAVARLAADVQLAPAAPVRVRRRVVALLEIGRVALGAHQVPVLIAPRPVQRIVGRELLSPVKGKTTLLAGAPGDRQAREAPAGELDQVLLERLDAEGELDLEVGGLAVRSLRVDEEPGLLPEKS